LPGETKEDHKETSVKYLVSRQRFELGSPEYEAGELISQARLQLLISENDTGPVTKRDIIPFHITEIKEKFIDLE
jgi:hypothetical protein